MVGCLTGASVRNVPRLTTGSYTEILDGVTRAPPTAARVATSASNLRYWSSPQRATEASRVSPNQLGATLIGAAGIFIFGSRIPDLATG
jgi:hypothetical protein